MTELNAIGIEWDGPHRCTVYLSRDPYDVWPCDGIALHVQIAWDWAPGYYWEEPELADVDGDAVAAAAWLEAHKDELLNDEGRTCF